MRKFIKHLSYLFCTILILSGFIPNISHAQAVDSETVNLLSSNSEKLVFSVSVPWKLLINEVLEVNGEQWTNLEIPGWQKIAQPGTPELPFLTKSIGVPFGATIDINVTPGRQHQVSLSAPVIPALNMRLGEDVPGFFTDDYAAPQYIYERIPDPSIYEQLSVYPGKLAGISNDGIMRQQRIAGISVYPIQLNMQKNILTIYEFLTVTVSFKNALQIENSLLPVDQPVYETFFQDTLLNYDTARSWQQEMSVISDITQDRLMADSPSIATIPWAPPEDAYRIVIDEEGMYQVTYDQLVAIGASILLEDPVYYQMFSQGEEIAIEVTGSEDNSFDDGDLIIFYGEAKETKYSDQNIYWLSAGITPGLRLGNRNASPVGTEIATDYPALVHYEEKYNQWYYYTNLPGDDDTERIMWEGLAYGFKESWTYNFSLLAPVSEGPASFTFSLFGNSNLQQNPDHHLKAKLNNVELGDITWNGITQLDWVLDIPADLLQAGANQLVLSLVKDLGVTNDVILLDWIELEYTNSFLTNNDLLNFAYESNGTHRFKINGFSDSDINVYDVTDPYGIIKLDGLPITIEEDSYSIDFEESVTSPKHYIAIAGSALKDVSSIIQDSPSDLQNTENSAEYIIITHSTFRPQAETLAAYRNGQGLSTMVVDIQDVYDEFAYGVVGVQPISDFLGFALTEWQAPAPAYVLLVGDGHYDPKNYFGFGRTSFIPPFLAMADPWTGETAADNRYVTLVGSDTLPDMIIGRLAVNNVSEAETVVNKIIAYEANLDPGDWQYKVLAVADLSDSAGNFPFISDELLSDIFPESFMTEKVYYGISPYLTSAQTKAGIINLINSGTLFVNYIGHGYYGGWSNIFRNIDIPSLTNISRLPIVLSMTCADGFFHFPQLYSSNREGLAETIVRSSIGGAIASWSPTGDGLVTGHDLLNRGFFQAYFDYGVDTIGEATLAGKLNLWTSGDELELLDVYTLFGDPALIFHRSTRAVEDTYEINEDTVINVAAEEGLLVNDLNPFSSPLSSLLFSEPSHGLITLETDGSFIYTPDEDWNGIDEFTYTIYDGVQQSNAATVTIIVNAINDPPVAINQVVLTKMENQIGITLMANDDGDSSGLSRTELITYEVLDPPANGLLQGTAPDLIYVPGEGYLGQDSFTFKANDGQYDSNTATVTIYVVAEIYNYYIPLLVK